MLSVFNLSLAENSMCKEVIKKYRGIKQQGACKPKISGGIKIE